MQVLKLRLCQNNVLERKWNKKTSIVESKFGHTVSFTNLNVNN